jgi:nucleoside-diphosphate-sugar epimerase
MSVLVTGHTGFIGQAAVRALQQSGLAWTGASRSNGLALDNPATLDLLPREPGVVLHLAGRTGVSASWEEPFSFHRANALTTLTALEHARRTGAAFIYVSSYMYGAPQHLPIGEDHPVACNNPYAWSKREGELFCEAYARDFDMSVTVLRPFNVFGPGQSQEHLIPHIIAQALQGDTISVQDLEPRRDYLWIDDFVDALVAVVKAPPKGFFVFNLGAGESASVQTVIDRVIEITGPRKIVSRQARRRNEIADCVCDASRFRQAFGWSAKVPLAQGLSLLIANKDP